MIESRTKSITLVRWQLSKPRRQTSSVTAALPFALILALLCALSVIWAVKDPLTFADILGMM
jgi:hypothetical protein